MGMGAERVGHGVNRIRKGGKGSGNIYEKEGMAPQEKFKDVFGAKPKRKVKICLIISCRANLVSCQISMSVSAEGEPWVMWVSAQVNLKIMELWNLKICKSDSAVNKSELIGEKQIRHIID